MVLGLQVKQLLLTIRAQYQPRWCSRTDSGWPPKYLHFPTCVTCRYGRKGDAQALLQEWVRDVGSEAGLTQFNARISSGAVGVPESRLEVSIPRLLLPLIRA